MIKNTLLIVIGVTTTLLLSVSCSQLIPTKYESLTSHEWETAVPETQGLDAGMLSQALDEVRGKSYYYSFLIIRNGFLVTEEYYNGRDADTRDNVYSATKSYISALIGIAIDKGYIESLDSKLFDFFPEHVGDDTDPRKLEITIRHLLTMRSGFADESRITWDVVRYAYDQIGGILSSELLFDPGTAFLYSSHGAHLLSGIITRATGMSTFAFADAFLFHPMGVGAVAWAVDESGIYSGGASMYLTPRDMARFGYLYLKNGMLDGHQIVRSDWVGESAVNHRGYAQPWGEMDDVGYGYLFWTGRFDEYPLYFASGYGGQWILVVPDLEMVVVATMNADTENIY